MLNLKWKLPFPAKLSLAICCVLSLPILADPSVSAPDHKVWNALVHSYVISQPGDKSTLVDYSGFAKAQSTLDSYLDYLATFDQARFDRLNKADQLAFLLNAYNSWTVKLVLQDYESIKSIKDLGALFTSPWKKVFIPLLGKKRSLDDIEHGLIRGSGRYQEPRIHFAANCASLACPPLREEAYVGDKLDAQLEHQAQRFLADKSRNRFEGNSLKVSAIFKWYRQDFASGWRGANTLEDFLALYAKPLALDQTTIKQLQEGKISIEFLDYDWRLNRK